MSLLYNTKLTTRKQSTATATRKSTTSFHDMSGFDGVLFMAVGSTLLNSTAGYAIVQSATANSTATTYNTTAIAFTNMSTATLNYKNLVVDVYKPTHRYVRMIVTGASSGHMRCIAALQYGARRQGTTDLRDSTTITGSTFVKGSSKI